ncbi:MAG: c-type cytochrome [Sphingomonadales bacterium]|nr:c-type cytochrome [Sphingomonadales bacterium]MDE2570332.1 c-type cytochrome [Sphingomonadales bacterium]
MSPPPLRGLVLAATVALPLAGCAKKAPDPIEQIVVRKPGDPPVVVPLASTDPVAAGKRAFAASCSACHAASADAAKGVGPALYGVIGRKAASVPGFAYSAAMKGSGLTWSGPEIEALIANPQGIVPGTSMNAGAVSDANARHAIVQYLKTLGPKG